jgi:allophanate hydrolase
MLDLTIDALRRAYRARRYTPVDVVLHVMERIESEPSGNVWISLVPREVILRYAEALEGRSLEELPLYGVPFAVKDNIDLAGVPTTAGCPAFSFVPDRSAPVVQRLIDAGAIPIGKTNLDQFATGLVGTRSPYGACSNAFDPAYISGGSSSGSAVAVASGVVSFALGTDTAGSGRVPAGFNNIVGLKPSRGRLSTRGVVPACRSLDCVSVFALTNDDAESVLRVAEAFDEHDEYSRDFSSIAEPACRAADGSVRIGVPRAAQLEFFGDTGYAAAFDDAIERVRAIGWQVVEIDFDPFAEAARLLYEGPWLAERYVALERFLLDHADAFHPVTRAIVQRGADGSAAQAFAAHYRLKQLERRTQAAWNEVDVLMVPTAPSIYSIADVEADPIALNSRLGTYTNFVNLLDLSAVAVPAGFRSDGLPFGVTLIGPCAADRMLLRYADRLHRASVERLGATRFAFPPPSNESALPRGHVGVVVCGAHMSGLPLNHQLTDRRAVPIRATRTAAKYRFYALPGGPPKRPGLVRVKEGGSAIDVEVWAVPEHAFGTFVDGIPSPLGIGKVELEDGSLVSGFLCEPIAIEGAEEITALGSWRTYVASLRTD